MNRAILFAAALFLVNGTPCSSLAVAQERPAAAPAASQQKEQYEKGMEERLGRLGKELDELKAKADVKARDEMKQLLKEAEKKQDAASRKLEEMRRASQEKWRKFSSDMNKAADDFEQAFDKAKSRFKD